MYFSGPVKTATKGFPRDWLLDYKYKQRGESIFLETTVETHPVYATGWNDGKIKTIVSSDGTTLQGNPHLKKIWSNEGEKS